jgi:hypothetical protein
VAIIWIRHFSVEFGYDSTLKYNGVEQCFSSFFSNFSCCTRSGDQPQEDLAKSGYKKNREIKNLRIQHMLMYLWNLLAKYENLKRRKLKICPNPSKILMSSELSFSKCGDSF